ncbi:MAG: AMP-binding protein [Candidatus Rokubacteria bacterium]|nr:AMP-binding protein [Candidatus Rokubacteria bacterium]
MESLDTQTVERRVIEIVEELLTELRGGSGRQAVSPDASVDRDLGLGSLERVELLLRLEQAFGVRLPDAVMAEADTLLDLVNAVHTAGPSAPEIVLRPSPRPSVGAPAPAASRTLADVLRWQAAAQPGRTHMFLREEDGSERPITYGALWDRASAIAAGLHARGLQRGDAVALMLRTEADFFGAFFGTLLAGGVPVPIYPPFRPDQIGEYLERQVRILQNAGARLLITFREAERVAALLMARVPSLAQVAGAQRLALPGAEPASVHLDPEDPALIQYTSGSTGEPKGVLLTHANLVANIRASGRAIAIGPDDVGVSWLPLYHDMGLIGWLLALYHGIPIVILSPLAFLARPARWLQALHAYRGTLSVAPNFAYELCVRKVTDDELQGLDLSSWRLAFNGAEPVSPDTLERFTRRFAPYGFRPAAMCPVYGLAEAAAALTVPPTERGPWVDRVVRERFQRDRVAHPAAPEDQNPLRFVSCGRPLSEHEVRIVDADGRPLGERIEGHIQFRGPSVTRGYFRNPDASRAAIHDGWMDSGDLGYTADGELFITGRRKDLIIKAGRNLYPQEVEEVVGNIPGIRKGCVAAFGIADPAIGTERLVVVAESRETTPEARARLEAAVIERLAATVGIPPDVVVIAPQGSVLKTSSGKVRRSATCDAYLAGKLGVRRWAWAQWAWLLMRGLGGRGGRLLGQALRLGYAAYVGLLLLPALPVIWALVLILPPGRPVDRLVRRFCRILLASAGCRIRVEGLDSLRGLGTAILAANHASYLDAVALSAALPLEFRFVAMRELEAVPFIKTVLGKVGHVMVERTDLSRSVADAGRVTAMLRGDVPLLVFPEGTFVRSAGLLPFKLGAFKAAVEAGCPVVPIILRGTREILPADTWLPRPGQITVTIGAPMKPEGEGWREVVRLRDAVRAEMARRCG